MKKWVIKQPDTKAVSVLTSKTDIKKPAAEILVSRGIDTIEKIKDFFSDDSLSSPFLLKDMQEAVDIINNAIEEQKAICIFGDYDCDGIISTVMLYLYLECLGAEVTYYIPERDEGYGMSCDAVRKLSEQGIQLIITVDNGISAVKESELIKELGMELVITDHHQPSDVLPTAGAIVDPHRSDCISPFKYLCGAGVVLKLLAALDDGNYEAVTEQFGDLAAIATIADIVPLVGENRTIVQNGLRLISNTENLGLSYLIEECRISPDNISSVSVAFMLAPRINASGRFGSPRTAVKLFLSEDEDEAQELCKELSELNSKRKQTEQEIVNEIEEVIEKNPTILNERVLIFEGENWHHGVIGIVSARILQKYGKPTFIISIEGDISRGSARSIEGYSVFKALSYCSEILEKFGGHTGAGGFSLSTDKIPLFKKMLAEYSKKEFPSMPRYSITAEKVIEPSDISMDTVLALDILEPFGERNPRPLFAMLGAVIEEIIPLSDGKHIKLKLNYHNTYIYGLLFGLSPDKFTLSAKETGDFIISLEKSTYGGSQNVSVKITDYRKSGISQAKYFAARETYEKYMLGEEIPQSLMDRIIPSREDLISVYKSLNASGISFDALFYKLSSDSMNYCKLRLCIDIFCELRLVKLDMTNENVSKSNINQKADLESSEILRKLRCVNNV